LPDLGNRLARSTCVGRRAGGPIWARFLLCVRGDMSVAPLLPELGFTTAPARLVAQPRQGLLPPPPYPVANDAGPSPAQLPQIDRQVDERHFMWLLVRNLVELQGYARRLTGQRAEASDLVQETCRRAIESNARFKAGSDMRAWLCCILRNCHLDRLRRSARETLVGDCDAPCPAPPPEGRARWSMVSDDDMALALASLRPQYRRAYVLHAIDGHTYDQIAHALCVPASTVGTRIMRARLYLREFLLQRIEPPPATRRRRQAGPAAPVRDDAPRTPRRRAPGRGPASGSRAARP
jgi:RNA polymerase sigma-70 factor (ECF subfamily)